MKLHTLESLREFTSHLSFSLFGQKLFARIEEDKKFCDPKHGRRLFLQVFYNAPCSKSGEIEEWKGRKFYLSEYMTESEVVFTALTAFKMAVEHEILEGFKFNGITVVNPHVDFRKLMEVSHHEVTRTHIPNFDI